MLLKACFRLTLLKPYIYDIFTCWRNSCLYFPSRFLYEWYIYNQIFQSFRKWPQSLFCSYMEFKDFLSFYIYIYELHEGYIYNYIYSHNTKSLKVSIQKRTKKPLFLYTFIFLIFVYYIYIYIYMKTFKVCFSLPRKGQSHLSLYMILEFRPYKRTKWPHHLWKFLSYMYS